MVLLAVAAAFLLPPLVYALDDEAPPKVRWRHSCADFEIRALGGFLTTFNLEDDLSADGGMGYGATRIRFSKGFAGLVGDFEDGNLGYNQQGVFALFRPQPRAHIEGGFELGYRRIQQDDFVLHGFEFALRSRYIFVPEWRSFGLELRPAFVVRADEPGLEGRLDAALLIPLGSFAHISAGGRVFSFYDKLNAGFWLELSWFGLDSFTD